jgi:hypothetical protein
MGGICRIFLFIIVDIDIAGCGRPDTGFTFLIILIKRNRYLNPGFGFWI